MAQVVPSQVVNLIDQMFPFAASQAIGDSGRFNMGMQSAGRLAALLDVLEKIPEELIVLDGSRYTDLVCSKAAIRTAIGMWEARGDVWPLTRVPGLDDLHPVTLIRRALASCPDEYPSATTTELGFIADPDLRESLRIDISASSKALSNGEWKAATVLAGSIIEALLLWALQQRTPLALAAIPKLVGNKTVNKDPGTTLENWHLHEYIEVALEVQVIGPQTAAQARLAKDFRNLIHPGRMQRLGQKCNRGTALSAVAAVELVIVDLRP